MLKLVEKIVFESVLKKLHCLAASNMFTSLCLGLGVPGVLKERLFAYDVFIKIDKRMIDIICKGPTQDGQIRTRNPELHKGEIFLNRQTLRMVSKI